ncbi:MAG TPA: glycosyltransferase [Arenicellales bacterium]|jgi:GT2 family glycosyltransferase|nr:glycosyltransferase [Arenicellales bacterium]
MQVSFLVPVYNTDPAVLTLCVNSVLKAAADRHQVVIVDDASDREETRAFLSRCGEAKLANLKLLRNDTNAGVSYALNQAAAVASGDLLAPVDHDDVVVSQGFAQTLRCLDYYQASWVYSDEIQVDANGFLIRRMFKPDYSPQLLRSIMYINHLQVFSRELFERVGGYREGFEGSQDHDLALRMSEQVEPVHAETIAYHWRILEQTQSRSGEQLSAQTVDHGQRALREHFARLQHEAAVEPVLFRRRPDSQPAPVGVYRSRLRCTRVPAISIVIPCQLGTKRKVNGIELTLLDHCLESIRRSLPLQDSPGPESPQVQIVLVLNHGDDVRQARELIEYHGLEGLAVCDESGFDFARKCNLGTRQASGDVLVFLNDDTELQTNGWTADVISLLEEDDVACVGGMLLNADLSVQSCGDNVGRNSAVHYAPHPSADNVGDAMHRYLADHETTSVSGAFLCCRKSTFNEFGGFSRAFPNSFQDVDFCLRARARGMRCITTPGIRLLHFESATRDAEVDFETLSGLRSFHGPGLAGTDRYALWRYQPIYFSVFSYNGLKFRAFLLARVFVRAARRVEKALTRRPRCWRGVLKKSEYRVH